MLLLVGGGRVGYLRELDRRLMVRCVGVGGSLGVGQLVTQDGRGQDTLATA